MVVVANGWTTRRLPLLLPSFLSASSTSRGGGSAARGFFHFRAKCREAAPRSETSYGKVGVLEWVLQASKTARRLLPPSFPYDDTTATPRRESLFAPGERASGEAELELAPWHSSGRVLWPVCGPPRLEGRRGPSHPHDSLRASTDQGKETVAVSPRFASPLLGATRAVGWAGGGNPRISRELEHAPGRAPRPGAAGRPRNLLFAQGGISKHPNQNRPNKQKPGEETRAASSSSSF